MKESERNEYGWKPQFKFHWKGSKYQNFTE